MLRDAWFLARSDAAHTLREKETLFWVVLMPVLFFYFIGTVTSGFGGGGRGADRLAVRIPADAGFLGDAIVQRLRAVDYEIVAPGPVDAKDAPPQLVLPERLTERVLAGDKVVVPLQVAAAGISKEYDAFRCGRAIYGVLADLVVCAESGAAPSAAAFAALAAQPRALRVRVESSGERKRIPNGFEQTIPGTLVMFTLLVLLTSGAVLLVIERRQGLLRRLAVAPIRRRDLVLGKWGGKMALGVAQIAVGMLTGTLLFDMQWGPNLPMIAVVLLAWAAFCASLGLVLGSVARSEGQAIGLGVLAANGLAALGGCWWPIEITPAWMQMLQKAIPTGWTMDALHQLISFGAPATAALPHVAALVVGAVVLGATAGRWFRFG